MFAILSFVCGGFFTEFLLCLFLTGCNFRWMFRECHRNCIWVWEKYRNSFSGVALCSCVITSVSSADQVVGGILTK